MQSKISFKWLSFIGGAVVVAFSTILIFLPNDTLIGSVQGANSILREQIDSGLPVRLVIPTIHVDAAVLPVGLTSEGAMDVPKSPADVAWFNRGPRSGETGSAVIAGHFGWKDNIPAVFDDLSALRKGDKIYVIDDKRATTTFVVSGSRLFGENGDASGVFNSKDGKVHLNLITCEGVWNALTRSYSQRLVVFADKE